MLKWLTELNIDTAHIEPGKSSVDRRMPSGQYLVALNPKNRDGYVIDDVKSFLLWEGRHNAKRACNYGGICGN